MGLIRSFQAWLGTHGVYLSRQEPYELAWQLRRLFPALGINCVIDVGAHIGEYGSFLRRVVGYHGRLVSFEPVKESFGDLISAAAGDPEWLTYPVALGATPGNTTMTVFGEGVFNSLLMPTQHAAERFGPSATAVGTERVEVSTLDDCVAECIDGIVDPRIYLKMDTQGYDQRVLDGGQQILEHVVALQSEIAITHLYVDVPPFEVALRRIQDLDFDPIGFFPITRERDELRVIEFDCVAARKPQLRSGLRD